MLIAMIAVGALFVLYASVKPRAGCTHNCGRCVKACGTSEPDHD